MTGKMGTSLALYGGEDVNLSSSERMPSELTKIVQRFKAYKDSKSRYEYLLSLGNSLPAMPIALRTRANKIQGCLSNTYVYCQVIDGRVFIQGYSDSLMIKGLLAILVFGLNGSSVEAVLSLDPAFIKEAGLNQSLTPSRSNGYYNVINEIKRRVKQG